MVTRMPVGAEPMRAAAPLPDVPALLRTGALAVLEDNARSLILRQMRPLKLKSGERAFRPGAECLSYVMVKKGSIKVCVHTESGREITLYRVQDGETCVLTTAGLISSGRYDAEGIAETETEAIILPKPAFDELIASSPVFRQFVFASFGDRLQSLIALVQEVTLRHVDRRLARHLLRMAKAGVIESTHQALARDLNTAREVVTRLLNDFSEKGYIEIARGRITILDERALEHFADVQ